eukprot:s895_g16.t1
MCGQPNLVPSVLYQMAYFGQSFPHYLPRTAQGLVRYLVGEHLCKDGHLERHARLISFAGNHCVSSCRVNWACSDASIWHHAQCCRHADATEAQSRNFGLETLVKEVMMISQFELDAAFGPHILFEQADERDRAESSCLSTLALVGGRYEAFTKPQAPKDQRREAKWKLTELLLSSQWDELEAIVRWIDPTPEQVHGALVLLSIRALAKSKMVIRQVPLDSKLPERTLLYLIEHERCVVPSVSFLSDDALNFVKNALEIHEQFNLAQMLQGENVPGSVMGLQDMIHDKGEDPISCGYFCIGLQGGEGSRFMTRKNAETTIAGIRMLQQLMKGRISRFWESSPCGKA